MKHPDYSDINKKFRHKDDWDDDVPLTFSAEEVAVYYLAFSSSNSHYLVGQPSYTCLDHCMTFPGESTREHPPDALVEQNIQFRYPLLREVTPTGLRQRLPHVVLLLHGLNERSYSKYIPWAYHIWRLSRAGVVLFPLAFHINRVLPEWGRLQQDLYTGRRKIPDNENTHRFNAVMSDRLGHHPERFFWGAMQSYWDLIQLARTIRAGQHAHIAPDARIDVLGYSAGGFLTLALLLEDCEGLFRESRGVMFSTCAAIRDINLSSPLIVDHAAEVALMKLFVKYNDRLMSDRMKHWIAMHPEGRWLNSFLGLMPNRVFLEARLRELAPRLLGITNINDQVMTSGAMLNALQGIRRDTGVRVEELSLGIHENPFSSPDYRQRDRDLILEFLNVERYGRGFEQFIALCAEYFR